MKNKCFGYIKIDEQNGFAETSGISWSEFYSGIAIKPKNVLILSGSPSNSDYNTALQLEYISTKNMQSFSQSNVYDYGNFCWIDFENVDDLTKISEQKLAELLFLNHKWKPLKSFKIAGLHNHYAYICHDDDWYVKVYMERIEDYRAVVEYKILKELKGRKRSIPPIPNDIMNKLFDLFKTGAVIDFERSISSCVNIYPVGNLQSMEYGIDGIHKQLDKHRLLQDGIRLEYYAKKWRIY